MSVILLYSVTAFHRRRCRPRGALAFAFASLAAFFSLSIRAWMDAIIKARSFIGSLRNSDGKI